jgi:hypothetical protein
MLRPREPRRMICMQGLPTKAQTVGQKGRAVISSPLQDVKGWDEWLQLSRNSPPSGTWMVPPRDQIQKPDEQQLDGSERPTRNSTLLDRPVEMLSTVKEALGSRSQAVVWQMSPEAC